MKVKIINEPNDYRITDQVNEFLATLEGKYKVDQIVYKTASSSFAAWNCVMIIYSEIV